MAPASKNTAATATQRFSTKNPYEAAFGYSRAIRRGPFIFISGTTAISPETGELLSADSAQGQALCAFDEIIRAVEALGGEKSDIVRVRMFVARESDSGAVGEALRDRLGNDVKPAATMILGARFVDEKMLVEIEADGVVLES